MLHAVKPGMLKETVARFGADDASTYAAAISYSTVFAIAPLIVVAIAVAGEVLGVTSGGHGHHVVEDQLIGAISRSAGPQTAGAVRDMVDTTYRSHQGSILAQVIGWVTFIIAASGLFLALQNALNHVWHVQPKRRGIIETFRNRAFSALMLLAIGVLMILTTVSNVVLSFVWTHLTQLLPFPGAGTLFTIVTWIVDTILLAAMFALIFKVLPDAEIAWRDVVPGAVATAVLFVVGQVLLSLYLSRAGIANGYGAAGSLVVLLVWVYYSAMLLLLGAEFTRVYAENRGSLVAPSPPGATKIPAATS